MARNGGEVLQKKNSKLEAFLKRNLDAHLFERIRAYEPCIVVSEKENKAFKYVFITDELIYLTENPPKNVSEEVHFKSVVSTELVNEFPDFLSGEERENTQHIAIKYLTNLPVKRKKSRDEKAKTHKSSSDIDDEKELHNKLSDEKNLSKSMTALSLGCRNANISENGKLDKKFASKTFDPNVLRIKEEHFNSNSLSNSLPSQQIKKLGLGSHDVDFKEHLRTHKHKKEHNGKSLPIRPLPPRSPAGSGDASDFQSDSNDLKTLSNGKSHKKRRSLPSPEIADNSDASNEHIPKIILHHSYGGELSIPVDEEFNANKSMSKVKGFFAKLSPRGGKKGYDSEDGDSPRSTSTEIEDHVFQDESPVETKECVLHLYVISTSSHLLMFIKSAWNNYLIRGTLELDDDFVHTPGSISPRGGTTPNEKLDLLFSQLKRELLEAANGLEDVFNLINELKLAAVRHLYLKKLFWKSPELFQFLVKQLTIYLPRASKLDMTTQQGRNQRADEYELVIIIIETLSLMFRETEVLPLRISCLKVNKGQTLRELVKVIVSTPEVPPRYSPPSKKAARLLRQSKADQWKMESDIELANLVKEITENAVVVIFELILIAKANWGGSGINFFNICWLVEQIEEEASQAEQLLNRVVNESMSLIAPNSISELSPKQAVILTRQFTILHTVVEYSKPLKHYVRENFREEFKYFIQSRIIHEKLPKRYPISQKCKELIQQVTSQVLGKQFELTIEN
ncbi:unnamed protein product [Owenia fusiformis]|uniref:Uncharacterized protein n=1 Tax=Owenia fusiformis TaxID=6347 RepID=A0A8J1T4Z8_OWEFU|nr:unnamed protein product [Owenia fusiformis]